MQYLVYLHGFLSSPQSVKAQQTRKYLSKTLPGLSIFMPELSGDINKALVTLDSLLNTLPTGKVGFIGSSMGGYLSTYCAEKHGGKAVLVNPAVEPFNLFSDYLGMHLNPNTGERFCINAQHINVLKKIYVPKLKQPENYLVMLQTGDETLDYRLALRRYRGANIILESGGDHSFVDYDKHLDKIFSFLR